MISKIRLTVGEVSPPLRIVFPPACDESPDPVCGRCGRRAGRTHAIAPGRRYCWECFDRHLTNLPAWKGVGP